MRLSSLVVSFRGMTDTFQVLYSRISLLPRSGKVLTLNRFPEARKKNGKRKKTKKFSNIKTSLYGKTKQKNHHEQSQKMN